MPLSLSEAEKASLKFMSSSHKVHVTGIGDI
jgi:hypothetical protein